MCTAHSGGISGYPRLPGRQGQATPADPAGRERGRRRDGGRLRGRAGSLARDGKGAGHPSPSLFVCRGARALSRETKPTSPGDEAPSPPQDPYRANPDNKVTTSSGRNPNPQPCVSGQARNFGFKSRCHPLQEPGCDHHHPGGAVLSSERQILTYLP